MGLRIFDTDPDAKPKERFSSDLVGRFRSGYMLSNQPTSLDFWRVTTGDPEVADRVASLFGGRSQEWEATGEDNLEVFTESATVNITLDGPKALRQSMTLYGRNNKRIRTCDGVEQTGEGKEGRPCECPASFDERKKSAKAGDGCQPDISIFFKLTDAPELGKFRFSSGSWTLVSEVSEPERKLAAINGPAYATLTLEEVKYTTKAGRDVRFVKPVLSILGAAPADDDGMSGWGDEPPF